MTFMADGRRVQLVEDIRYVDPAGLEWFVPAKAVVDGASIPRALWTLVGGPFEGKYRDASVIHDWYCDRRNRPWRDVHRVFFDAMITSEVSLLQAKILYAGVVAGGPRWSDTVVQNNSIESPRIRSASSARRATFDAHRRPRLYSPGTLEVAELQRLSALIEAQQPSLDEIDALAEAAIGKP